MSTNYGRYKDDPEHVGCPRAQSDMTPCIARDGRTALANDFHCVGCGAKPGTLLAEIQADGYSFPEGPNQPSVAANRLQGVVRKMTEPTP